MAHPRVPGTRRRHTRVFAAVVLAVVGFAASGVAGATQPAPEMPRWRGDPQECRQDPMTHVHDPDRLHVLAQCATVEGTVRHVALDTSFNDLKIVIEADPEYRRYLREENRGVFVADVIATDLLRVPVPRAGARVRAYGAWVLDRAKDQTALLPTYRIDITEGKARSGGVPGLAQPRPGQGDLALSARAPATVTIGERIPVTIRSEWRANDGRQPASKIHLFVEVTTADGLAVHWQATRTNSLGVSTVHLLALQPPGRYTVTVYATPAGEASTTTAEFRIRR